MTAKGKRLDRLEARHAARVAQVDAVGERGEELTRQARELAHALPDALRERVQAHGARGFGVLLEAAWEVGGGDDLPTVALRAYAHAFGDVSA